MGKAGFLAPLGIFLLLVIFLALGFGLDDPHYLPSQLINRPFPEFDLDELHNESQIISRKDLKGEVSLVNVWATWCPNCVIEHPELLRIAKSEDVRLVGINYKDDSEKARTWLQRLENPYAFNIVDREGRLGIDLGVYGAPETFIVDRNGVIQYRYVGPITEEIWEERLEPVVDALSRPQAELNP